MKSKKTLFVLAALGAVAALGACGNTPTGNGNKPTPSEIPEAERTAVQKAIVDAEGLSQSDLFAKAAEELGTTGKLKILATTSRGGKDAVKNKFIELLQAHNPAITDPLQYDTTVDGTIYTTLLAEITSGVKDGYSGTICQDGYQLATKGLPTEAGDFQNYIPKEWKDSTTTNKELDGNPFTLQYNFKTWMYNNKNGNMVIDNVWDVTHSQYKGKIDTMDPRNENVNMDWLIQLTADEEVAKLKAAYEDSTATTDVNLDSYSKYGSKKYAYAFIDRFLDNAIFYEDDGKAMTHLAQTPGNIGWIVYSKILKVEESEAISKKNIVIASLGNDNTDGATKGASSIKGFGGFMYKHYLQVMPNAKYPYATCAFFNLISTDATAYSVWAGDVGDYPSLPGINKDRTKGGNVEGETLYPCLNDPTSDWWLDKGEAVVETPTFIGDHYDDVIDAIDAAIARK